MNVSENSSAARSRIMDADFASETAALAKNQILQQAGISVLAQANRSLRTYWLCFSKLLTLFECGEPGGNFTARHLSARVRAFRIARGG